MNTADRISLLSEVRQELLKKLLAHGDFDPSHFPVHARPAGVEALPLSRSQEAMWFTHSMSTDPSALNLPSAVRLRGLLNIDALRRSLEEIVDRHEILRTVFPALDGRPRQQVLPSSFKLQVVDCSAGSLADAETRSLEFAALTAKRPFDLARGPLWRAELYTVAPDDHVLVLVFHHLIWDGWSIGVFIAELSVFYGAFLEGNNRALPRPGVQFADFALWERSWLTGPLLERRLSWWEERLDGCQQLAFPTDRPRPNVQRSPASMVGIEYDRALTEALDALASKSNATIFMTMLAAFAALVSRHAGQERFAIGTPAANRLRSEFMRAIGPFANIVVLPMDVSGDPRFSDWLARVTDLARDAYAHQDVPYELIVDRVRAERFVNVNPLFQVMFALHRELVTDLRLPGITVEAVDVRSETAHFDLGLHLWRREKGLSGYCVFNRDLFDSQTVERILQRYRRLLEDIVNHPAIRLSELCLLPDAERLWLRQRQLTTQVQAATHQVADTIVDQAARHGDAIAWFNNGPESDGPLHYAVLLERVERLADALSERSFSSPLGLCLPLGTDWVVAIVAALRAGVVFVPLPLSMSPSQLAVVMKTAGVEKVIADVSMADRVGGRHRIWTAPAQARVHNRPALDPETIAYISLAAGHPVAVTHGQLANRLAALSNAFPLAVGEALVGFSPVDSDLFPLEVLWPLTRGATIARGCDLQDEHARHRWSGRAYLHVTPGQLEACRPTEFAAEPRGLLCSGGLLDRDAALTAARHLGCPLFYLYNPPEAQCELACAGVSLGNEAFVDAGAPWSSLTIRDTRGEVVPIGVTGTVCAGSVESRERGHWTDDGQLKLDGLAPGWVWHEGRRIDLRTVAAHLERLGPVLGAHVVERRLGGDRAVVAYVVPSRPGDREGIERAVRDAVPASLQTAIVLIDRVPLNRWGRVDERALEAFPLLGEAVVRRLEEGLRRQPGVSEAAAFIEPASYVGARLHLADISTASWAGWASGSITQQVPARRYDLSEGLARASASGGTLVMPRDAPANLVDALERHARRPQAVAGITLVESDGDRVYLAYDELYDEATRALGQLQRRGLRSGDRLLLQLRPLRDQTIALWACILGGIVPVMVAVPPTYEQKGGVLAKLWSVWELLNRPPILVSEQDGPALDASRSLYYSDVRNRTACDGALRLWDYTPVTENDSRGIIHAVRPEDLLCIQPSSGSTGAPKCVQITHGGVIHQIHGAAAANDYTDADVFLNWLPFDHVMSILSLHMTSVYLGARQVHVETKLLLTDPLRALDLVDELRVTVTAGPNFIYQLMSEAIAGSRGKRWALDSLRIIINGGEQVTLRVVEEFLRRTAPFGLRPDAMQPGFGMAEACTGVTFRRDFSLATAGHRIRRNSLAGVLQDADREEPDGVQFIDLGPPRKGAAIRIVDSADRVLPERVIGCLQIRSGSITPGYANNEPANQHAFTRDGWFDTGDLGFIVNGRLTITGRSKEILIVRGENYYCHDIEDAVGRIEGVEPTFVAACAMRDPTTEAEGFMLFFVPTRPGLDVALIHTIREQVVRQFGISPTYVLPIPRERFPKTTGGKIQRANLQQALFEGAFDLKLKEVDLALASARTLPGWFYQWGWRRAEPHRTHVSSARVMLVFDDDPRLATVLTDRHSDDIVRVEKGPGFVRRSSGCFVIDPTEPEDYRRLAEALHREGRVVDRCIHLWSYLPPATLDSIEDVERAQLDGALSLLFTVQALFGVQGEALSVFLLVVSRNVLDAAASELALERGTLRGFVRSIPQEWPMLNARLVDLTTLGPEAIADELLECVECELSTTTTESEVIWRGGERWVPRLEPARLDASRPLPFRRGQLMIIAGGLGGIGVALARYLLQEWDARVLLLGRTDLAGEDGSLGEGLAPPMSIAVRRQNLRELEALPGDVLYRKVDIADIAAVRAAIADAQERWSAPIGGAFHLAGTFPTRLAVEETAGSFLETLSPKVSGAWVLDRLLPADAFVISFGSVYGAFGGAAGSAYASASSALANAFDARRRRGERIHCLSWSHWEDIGMSREFPFREQSLQQGYGFINADRAMASLLAALQSSVGDIVIGLDPRKANIRHRLDGGAEQAERLRAYVVKSSMTSDVALPTTVVADDLAGQSRSFNVVVVPDIPRSALGGIEHDGLSGGSEGAVVGRGIPPRTSTERTIAAVWMEILRLDAVGLDDSFFSLGGQSIQLVQAVARLQSALDRRLNVVDLFRYPTVRALAEFIGGRLEPTSRTLRASVRANRQRQARHTRLRPTTASS